MAYLRQFIIANDLISSQEINQISDNIEQVRTSHKGATEAAGKIPGALWIDDSVEPWKLKIYSGTAWLNIGTIDPNDEQAYGVAQDHVTDNDTPVIDETALIVTSVMPQDTWASVGPTGSGADDIWTALDSVPLNADWLEIRQNAFVNTTAGLALQLQIYARSFQSAVARSVTNHILHLKQQIPGDANSSINQETSAKVHLDAQNRFELNWDLTSGSGVTVRIYVTGYGFNR